MGRRPGGNKMGKEGGVGFEYKRSLDAKITRKPSPLITGESLYQGFFYFNIAMMRAITEMTMGIIR